MSIQFIVDPIPLGEKLEGCTVIRTKQHVFVKTAAGNVYITNQRVDLVNSWICDDETRRAYCRLAGVKFSDLQKARKAVNDRQKTAAAKRDLLRMKSIAKKHGYKLTKVKA